MSHIPESFVEEPEKPIRRGWVIIAAAAAVILALGAGAAMLLLRGAPAENAAQNPPADPFAAATGEADDAFAEAGGAAEAAPTNLRAQSLPVYDLALAWDAVEGAEEYNIYRRRVDILGAPERIGSVDGNTQGFVDANASCGATYQYTLSAVVNHEEQYSLPADRLQLTLAPCAAASMAALNAEAPALNFMTAQTGEVGAVRLTTATFAALSPALLHESRVPAVRPLDGGQTYLLLGADGSRIGQEGIWGNGNIGYETIWGNGNIGIWGNGNIGIWGNGGTFMDVYIVPAGTIPTGGEAIPDPHEWIPQVNDWIPIPDQWVPQPNDWIPQPDSWIPVVGSWHPQPNEWIPDPDQWIPHQGTVEITTDGLVLHPADPLNTALAAGGGFYLIPKDVLPYVPLQQMPAVAGEAGGVMLLGTNPGGHLHSVTGDSGAFQDPLVGFFDPLEGFQDPLVGFQDPLVGMAFPYAPAIPDASYIALAGDDMSYGVFTLHPDGLDARVEYFVYTPMDGALILTPYAALPDLEVGGACSSGDGVCDPTCTGGVDADCALQTCISGDGVCSPSCASAPDYQTTMAVGVSSANLAAAHTDLDCLSGEAGFQGASLPAVAACDPHDGMCSPSCLPTAEAGFDWECATPCATDGVCSPVCQSAASSGRSGVTESSVEALTAAYLQALFAPADLGSSSAPGSYSKSLLAAAEPSGGTHCFDLPAEYEGGAASPDQVLSRALLSPGDLCLSGAGGASVLPGLPGISSPNCGASEASPVTVRICLPTVTAQTGGGDDPCSSMLGIACLGSLLAGASTDAPGDSTAPEADPTSEPAGDDGPSCGSLYSCMKEALQGAVASGGEEAAASEPSAEESAGESGEEDPQCQGSLYQCMKGLITDAIEDAPSEPESDEQPAESPAQPASDPCAHITNLYERMSCELMGSFEDALEDGGAPDCADAESVAGGQVCTGEGEPLTLFTVIVTGVYQQAILPDGTDPDCAVACTGGADSCACAPNTAFPLQGCFNPNALMAAPASTPTPTVGSTSSATNVPPPAAAGSLCAQNGGIQWTGETCICPGVVDLVTICADGAKFDQVTDTACTPTQSCNVQAGGTGGTGGSTGGGTAVCGNGVVEAGEACENNSHCGAGEFCDASCGCQIIN